MAGWIKLHRDILEWEWADDPNVFSFFIRLILKVNHEDKKWRGQIIKAGQIVTSYEKLGEMLGVSESSVRRHLKKLSITGEIQLETKNGVGIVVTITKYSEFQVNKRKVVKTS